MNIIQQTISSIASVPLVQERWLSHNCPACVYNNQPRPDTKKRGGLRFSIDGSVNFSCFNCAYKASWRPGYTLSDKLKSLLVYYGADNSTIINITLIMQEIKEKGDFVLPESDRIFEKIIPVDLPEGTHNFCYWAGLESVPKDFIKVMTKVSERNFNILESFNLHWCPSKENELNERFIIPYYMNGKVVGYTARHIWWDKTRMKYLNKYPTNMLYNFDLLNQENIKTILVTEGPLDAGLVGGVATNNYEIKPSQLEHLKKSNKNIVIVPDCDTNGKKMVQQALAHNFSVSLPEWGNYIADDGLEYKIKDIEHCVRLYGRLFTRLLIEKYTYTDPFEIKVLMNKWFI